jgi:maleamate amidohydrolase
VIQSISNSGKSESKYQAQGFGALDIGFGKRPAIVVVDFQLGFTSADSVLGGSSLVDAAVQQTAQLLAQARSKSIPVVQAFVGSYCERDALMWKIPAVRTEFHWGKRACELDPRIFDPSYDVVVQKIAPSVFFQTHAISYLVKSRIDTVIVVGCNTSGCVRATIVDAFSYGFRVIVPKECCGDVDVEPHNDNLRDVGRRYADVISAADALEFIKAFPSETFKESSS